jgi:hypothetical protein
VKGREERRTRACYVFLRGGQHVIYSAEFPKYPSSNFRPLRWIRLCSARERSKRLHYMRLYETTEEFMYCTLNAYDANYEALQRDGEG